MFYVFLAALGVVQTPNRKTPKSVTVLDFEAILAGGSMRMELPCAASPGPCGFSDFRPVAAPVYPSPEAASTMWPKKLLPVVRAKAIRSPRDHNLMGRQIS